MFLKDVIAFHVYGKDRASLSYNMFRQILQIHNRKINDLVIACSEVYLVIRLHIE